jgi:hypothetical protein
MAVRTQLKYGRWATNQRLDRGWQEPGRLMIDLLQIIGEAMSRSINAATVCNCWFSR